MDLFSLKSLDYTLLELVPGDYQAPAPAVWVAELVACLAPDMVLVPRKGSVAYYEQRIETLVKKSNHPPKKSEGGTVEVWLKFWEDHSMTQEEISQLSGWSIRTLSRYRSKRKWR